jgi:hypothetical protein
MTTTTPPTPLFTAFLKLGGDITAGVHLTPDECAAVVGYLQRHGISGQFARESMMMMPKNERPGLRPVVVKEAT